MNEPHHKTDAPPPRDPRLDPEPGDGIKTERGARHVVRVFSDGEGIQVTYSDTSGGLPKRTCLLSTWRRWAQHGTPV